MSAIPQFYFPKQPISLNKNESYNHDLMIKVAELYNDKEYLTESEFIAVTDSCSLPRYINLALFRSIDSISNSQPTEQITFENFKRGWPAITDGYDYQEINSIMYSILKKPDFDCITPDDFLPVLEDIVLNHPALKFLENNITFQERYIETVICRIFYEAHCPSGKLSLKQFTKSGFVSILQNLDPFVDLYTVRNIFSYKQFYVLYCKLWSLDLDHDLSISESDLSNYNMGTLTRLTVERIMKVGHIAAFTEPNVIVLENGESKNLLPPNITYFDFIWFLLSEVDKSTPMAIDYWFRCLDIDEDGVLSGYELYKFWQDQNSKQKLYTEIASSESSIQFTDIIRQMNDLIQPVVPGQFMLKDLKKNGFLAERFFDTFINFDRFQVHDSHQEGSIREQQCFELSQCQKNGILDIFEPTILVDDLGFPMLSNWDDYADFEYDRIIIDENYTNNTLENQQDSAVEDLLSIQEDEGITILSAYDKMNDDIDSCLISNPTDDDDIFIEHVNDASAVEIEDNFLFDATDEIKEEAQDDEFSDDSYSISSCESETHTPEMQNKFLSNKSIEPIQTEATTATFISNTLENNR